MCALFLLFALLFSSSSTCQALLEAAPDIATSPLVSRSLRSSTKPISTAIAPSPSTSTSRSSSSGDIAKTSGDFSSNDNGLPFPDKRGAASHTSRPSLRPSAKPSTSPTPSIVTTSDTTSNKLVETKKDFQLYLTLYLSNINSEMNATTTEIFQNATHTFMVKNIPSSPGVNVDVASIIVIGQLPIRSGDDKEVEVSALQVDIVVSGWIAMDQDVTNLTRIAVQNSISLTPYSNSDLLWSYLNTTSAFFKSIDLVTTSFDNENIPMPPINAEVDGRTVSKPMAVATAGTLAMVLLLALGGFIAFRQHRKRAMRQKKLSGNKDDSIEGNCVGRPPVQQIGSDDQASVASSISSMMSEIHCGVGRYLNGQSGGTPKEHYPVQERKMPDQIEGMCSVREQRSDQASTNVSVMSDLLFDNWSVFAAVGTINMIDVKEKDDLVGTFASSAEIQEPSEASSWGSIERQKSFGYF